MAALTRARLEEFLLERLAADDVRRLLPLAASCIRLHATGAAQSTGSRFGGAPLLPEDVEWPHWRGRPRSFLAQIRLGDVGDPDLATPDGTLLFFYDAEEQESWGFNPADRKAWRLVHVTDDVSVDERPNPAGALVSPARGLQFVSELSMPNPWEDAVLDIFNPEREIYANHASELFDVLHFDIPEFRKEPIHQLHGWPTVIQRPMQHQAQLASNGIDVSDSNGYEDPRTSELLRGAKSWRLLLQLDSDDDLEWCWGDGGRLYFWIREQDLRERRFDTSWCILQCY